MKKFPETEQGNDDLASKQSPQIAADTESRNQEKDTSDAEQYPGRIDEKGRGSAPETV